MAPIIPSAPAHSEPQPAAKSGEEPPKSPPNPPPKAETAVASAANDASASPGNASAKAIVPSAAKRDKSDKTAGKIVGSAVKPELPASAPSGDALAPALKGSPTVANTALPSAAAQPAPPKEPSVSALPQDVLGQFYTN